MFIANMMFFAVGAFKKQEIRILLMLLDTVYNYSNFLSGEKLYRTCINSYQMSKMGSL